MLQVVIDIDGDGSFLMNCQELATIFIEKLDVKCFIMNNQHLGMVVQWEDRFYKKNRAHTYLGHRVRPTLIFTKFSLFSILLCASFCPIMLLWSLASFAYVNMELLRLRPTLPSFEISRTAM